jgi:hypothetical protein
MGTEVELDLEGAGLKPPPSATVIEPEPGAVRAESPTTATTTAPSTAVTPGARGNRSPAPLFESGPLLGSDSVTAALAALAIGLVLGLIPAFEVSRRNAANKLPALMEELEESVDRPLAARAGKIRAPKAIVSDAEDIYGDFRMTFLLVWFGVALPAAGVLWKIKRPS